MRIHEEYLNINKHIIYSKKIIFDDNYDYIVFLHEGLGCVELWKDFPEKLCKALSKNAILYDRRGYGRSSSLDFSDNTRYMHEEALEILPAVLDYYSIKKPILYGHSDGGTISLIYAGEHTDSPKAVITEAAHSHREKIGEDGIKKTVKFYDKVLKHKLYKYHKDNLQNVFEGWSGNWLSDAFENWTIYDELGKIKCPVLVLQGENDRYATKEHPEIIAGKINSYAKAVLINNADHAPHKENYDDVKNNVEEFFKLYSKT